MRIRQGDQTYYYDAASGAVKSDRTSITGYGKGTDHVGSASNTQDGYEPGETYTNKVVKVVISEATAKSDDGKTPAKDQGITVNWVE